MRALSPTPSPAAPKFVFRAFRAAGRPLGQLLMQSSGLPVHIAGQLRLDRWQGRDSVQLIVDDAAPAT